jgi:hypothetical protein
MILINRNRWAPKFYFFPLSNVSTLWWFFCLLLLLHFCRNWDSKMQFHFYFHTPHISTPLLIKWKLKQYSKATKLLDRPDSSVGFDCFNYHLINTWYSGFVVQDWSQGPSGFRKWIYHSSAWECQPICNYFNYSPFDQTSSQQQVYLDPLFAKEKVVFQFHHLGFEPLTKVSFNDIWNCRAKSTELLDRPKSSVVKVSDSQEKIKSDILMTWNPFKTQRFKHLRARCRLHWSRKHAIKLLMLILK